MTKKTPIPFNEKCFFPPKNIYIYKEWAGCPHNSADWKSNPWLCSTPSAVSLKLLRNHKLLAAGLDARASCRIFAAVELFTKTQILMKNLMMLALAAIFSLSMSAQEPQKKQECCKKAKTEQCDKKKCDKKKCDKKKCDKTCDKKCDKKCDKTCKKACEKK